MNTTEYGWGQGYGDTPKLQTRPSVSPYQEIAYHMSNEKIRRQNKAYEMSENSDQQEI